MINLILVFVSKEIKIKVKIITKLSLSPILKIEKKN